MKLLHTSDHLHENSFQRSDHAIFAYTLSFSSDCTTVCVIHLSNKCNV
jgi:hypothetical protein